MARKLCFILPRVPQYVIQRKSLQWGQALHLTH